MREGVALALGSGREQELAHRRGHPHRIRRDVAGREHHGVVDRHPGTDRTARGVDVERDVLGGVFGGQQQNLGAQSVGDIVVDLRAEEDDALGEQALIDRVGQVQPYRTGTHVSHDLIPTFRTLRNPLCREAPSTSSTPTLANPAPADFTARHSFAVGVTRPGRPAGHRTGRAGRRMPNRVPPVGRRTRWCRLRCRRCR